MHWTMWENVITNEYGTNDLCQCQVSIPTIGCDGATPTRIIYRKYKHHITGEYIEQWNMLECRKRQSKCFTEFIFWYWMQRLVIYPAKICRFGRRAGLLSPSPSLYGIVSRCFTYCANLPLCQRHFWAEPVPNQFFFLGGGQFLYNTFDTFYMEAARKCPWTAGPNKSAMAPFHFCGTRFFENIVMTSLHKIWNPGGPCDRSHRQSTPHWSHGMSFFHLFPWLGWYGVPQF